MAEEKKTFDQSKDADAPLQGPKDNSRQDRGTELNRSDSPPGVEDSKSEMKPSPVVPHGSKAKGE